jgi:predicted flap endonuclease-1-like 5' DNA nuclease
MLHYLVELAIWMLIVYFVGCLVGWALRNLFGASESAPMPVAEPVRAAPAPASTYVPTPTSSPPSPPASVAMPRTVVAPTPVTVVREVKEPTVVLPIAGKVERPRGIAAARGGKADNLQRISGIGPKNESILHNLGFFHFDQIAAWTESQVAWVDEHLRFGGRIKREEWIKQAGLLSEGKEAEFTKLYGTGGTRK